MIPSLNTLILMKNILILLRRHQYIKNLFIFTPLFFAAGIMDGKLFINALIAFFAFSMSASAIYILNDYRDIEEDKKHPTKKHRPLASGAVDKTVALFIMSCLMVVGLLIMALLSIQSFFFLLGYIFLNIAYSFGLKHISILDIVCISAGFVIRLFIGSTTTTTPLSMWIILITFLLALFFGIGKTKG